MVEPCLSAQQRILADLECELQRQLGQAKAELPVQERRKRLESQLCTVESKLERNVQREQALSSELERIKAYVTSQTQKRDELRTQLEKTKLEEREASAAEVPTGCKVETAILAQIDELRCQLRSIRTVTQAACRPVLSPLPVGGMVAVPVCHDLSPNNAGCAATGADPDVLAATTHGLGLESAPSIEVVPADTRQLREQTASRY